MDEPHPVEEKLLALNTAMQEYVNVALENCEECPNHNPRLVTGMVVVFETHGTDEQTGRDSYDINYVIPTPGPISVAAGLLKIGSDMVSRDLMDRIE